MIWNFCSLWVPLFIEHVCMFLGEVVAVLLVLVLIWSLLTSISRVLLGRHFLLDVVEGALVGVLNGAFVHWFLKLCFFKFFNRWTQYCLTIHVVPYFLFGFTIFVYFILFYYLSSLVLSISAMIFDFVAEFPKFPLLLFHVHKKWWWMIWIPEYVHTTFMPCLMVDAFAFLIMCIKAFFDCVHKTFMHCFLKMSRSIHCLN